MTISSSTRIAGPFTGNGVAYLFPFTFKVFSAADLWVGTGAIATGVQATLALGTDYTVALNANQDSNPGGTVILTAGPLAVGYRLAVSSAIANLQPTEFLNQGGFYPEVVTTSLDRATILIQQLADGVDRSLQFPLTDPDTNNILPAAEERAGQVLGFDDDGAPTILPNLPGPQGVPGPPGTIVWPPGSLTLLDTVTGAPITISITNGALTYGPGTPVGAVGSITLIDTVTGDPIVISIANGALVY